MKNYFVIKGQVYFYSSEEEKRRIIEDLNNEDR